MANPFESAVGAVVGDLEKLTATLADLMAGPVTALSNCLRTLTDRVGAVTATFAGPVSQITDRVGEAMDSVGKLAGSVAQAAAGPITALATTINPLVTALSNLAGQAGSMAAGPFVAASQQIGNVTAGFAGIVGALGGFAEAITGPADAMKQFVGALAPGLLEQFNYAVRTLEATIGAALAPAFQVFAAMIQRVAGEIDPVMRGLAPVFEQLANVVASVVLPIVRVMAAVLEALTPLFQFLADVLEALTPLFTAVATVVEALIKTVGGLLASFFGGDAMKGAMDGFKKAVEEVAKQIVLLSARLALLFGATGFVKELIASLEQQKQPGQGEAPAPTGVHSASLESIGQAAAEAAFLAGGAGGGQKTDNALLTEILSGLKDMKQDSVATILQNWWDNHVVKDLPGIIAAASVAAAQAGVGAGVKATGQTGAGALSGLAAGLHGLGLI